VLVEEKETGGNCGSCNPYKLIAKEETDKTPVAEDFCNGRLND